MTDCLTLSASSSPPFLISDLVPLITSFKVGDGDVIVFGKIDCSPKRLREVMNEEDFDQKLVKATLPGVSVDFPDWFKITVTQIFIRSEIVNRFIDIGE